MIPIKRRCRFFNSCHFADATSRTCTVDAGGDYCGAYRTRAEKEKEKMK
ncbi:MAG: hypothetical protein U9N01_04450 [Euryarchaeota archaeon]|nr:hypothetical protein [Euryarchaeota archaeon]